MGVPSRIPGWAAANPAILFVALALGFSWSLWVPMILSQQGLLPFKVPVNPLGSFGPAAAALVTAWITGSPAPRAILRRLLAWRAGARWYAVSLFGPACLWLAAAAVHSLATGSFPAPQRLDRWYLVLPIAAVILVLGGPLGEEIGWRGFLLPHLQQRRSPLVASLIVGVVWFVWHVPVFWLEGAAQKGSSMAGFALVVVAMSILFTWVYNRTQGSVLLAVLFHTGVNTVGVCGGVVAPSLDESALFNGLYGAALALAALAVLAVEGPSLGRRQTGIADAAPL